MARVKGGPRTKNKHKKIIKLAKGYRGTRGRLFKRSQEAVFRAGEHAFHGRRVRRRDLKKLWIARINAALLKYGVRYSEFMNYLKKSDIRLNKKMLSEMAIKDPNGFEQVLQKAKSLTNK